jgi:hypothetical protein
MLLKYILKVYKYILKVYKYAIKVYKDPERSLIRSENKGKIDVYAWVNTILNIIINSRLNINLLIY